MPVTFPLSRVFIQILSPGGFPQAIGPLEPDIKEDMG